MKPDASGVPLWRQLQATAQVVAAVRCGVSGTAALEDVDPALKAGVQALSFYVWRNLGRAESLRDLLVSKRPSAKVDALLCVALALLWDEERQAYDGFTLVNQAVEATKRTQGLAVQANFINACLRRFQRERTELIGRTQSSLVALWNHPLWWVHHLQKQRPEDWQEVLRSANSQAPMTLRVNTRKVAPTDYLVQLRGVGIDAELQSGGSLVLNRPVPVHQLPGFAQGQVSVQDAAAQMAAPLLLPISGVGQKARILDACAAPGGKTGHLLELQDCEVIALEVDPARAHRIGENLERLGLRANIIAADANDVGEWWDGVPFDAVLLDAPCTASGITRRHPDVRWLRRRSDISQLALQQKALLQNLWGVLRPGGRLLYCTCSIFQEEGDAQVQTFLANNNNAALLPSPGHLMPQNGANPQLLNHNLPGDHDGFFYALFEKKSS